MLKFALDADSIGQGVAGKAVQNVLQDKVLPKNYSATLFIPFFNLFLVLALVFYPVKNC